MDLKTVNMYLFQIENSESTATKSRSRNSSVEDDKDIEAGPSSSSASSTAADKRGERMKRLRELHLRRVWLSFCCFNCY